MSFYHRNKYRIKYSQNFLRHDCAIALVEQMNLEADDVVVEIGPGTGQLTRHLLSRVKLVLAIEQDPNLAKKISREFQRYSNFVCISTDFLRWQLPLTGFKVVGNIPFVHTAAIMRKLVNHQSPPLASYLIMQLEAAQKFSGNPKESLFSLQIKPDFAISIARVLSRSCFIPVPKVTAALLKVQKRREPVIDCDSRVGFNRFIQEAFADFSPSAHRALNKRLTSSQLRKIQQLGINLNCTRAEIKFEEWVEIFKTAEDQP